MYETEKELTATYQTCSDVELATLNAQAESLTDAARLALAAEIKRRGISDGQLAKLHTSELRHEAKIDRRQKEHRKRVLSFLLRGSPKEFLYFMLVVLVILAVVALLDR